MKLEDVIKGIDQQISQFSNIYKYFKKRDTEVSSVFLRKKNTYFVYLVRYPVKAFVILNSKTVFF